MSQKLFKYRLVGRNDKFYIQRKIEGGWTLVEQFDDFDSAFDAANIIQEKLTVYKSWEQLEESE